MTDAKTQVKGHDSPSRVTPQEAGRMGAQARERKRMANIGETRQKLEQLAPEAVEVMHQIMREQTPTIVEGARGSVVAFEPRGPRFQAAKYILDQVLGQAAQRIEHVNLDTIDAEFAGLLERMPAK